MNKYLIESNHSPEECTRVLKMVLSLGYITHYDWGCEDGIHTGWAMVEAESPEQALLSVPTALRRLARIVRVTKFSPEMIEQFHSKSGS